VPSVSMSCANTAHERYEARRGDVGSTDVAHGVFATVHRSSRMGVILASITVTTHTNINRQIVACVHVHDPPSMYPSHCVSSTDVAVIGSTWHGSPFLRCACGPGFFGLVCFRSGVLWIFR